MLVFLEKIYNSLFMEYFTAILSGIIFFMSSITFQEWELVVCFVLCWILLIDPLLKIIALGKIYYLNIDYFKGYNFIFCYFDVFEFLTINFFLISELINYSNANKVPQWVL